MHFVQKGFAVSISALSTGDQNKSSRSIQIRRDIDKLKIEVRDKYETYEQRYCFCPNQVFRNGLIKQQNVSATASEIFLKRLERLNVQLCNWIVLIQWNNFCHTVFIKSKIYRIRYIPYTVQCV